MQSRESRLTENRYVSMLKAMTLWQPYGAAQPVHGSRKLNEMKYTGEIDRYRKLNRFDKLTL